MTEVASVCFSPTRMRSGSREAYCPAALRRREQLVQVGCVDDPHDGFAPVLEGYRNREQRKSLTVIGRAVERVDDPAPIARGVAPAAALLAQNGMVGITLRDHAGNQFLALPVGARHHVVDVGFGLDRQPVAPEVGELYSARGLRQLHGEFQQFVVHAIRIRRNTCRTAEWSPRLCRTARVRSFRWASGWRPRPDRSRSAAI